MTWSVQQTRRFSRQYKKLHDNTAADVDSAVDEVRKNPKIGERKKGDLAALRGFAQTCIRCHPPIDQVGVEQVSLHGNSPPVSASAMAAFVAGVSQLALASSMLHCMFNSLRNFAWCVQFNSLWPS